MLDLNLDFKELEKEYGLKGLIKELEQVSGDNQGNKNFFYLLAQSYDKDRKYARAVRNYLSALKQDCSDKEVIKKTFNLLMKTGKKDQARDVLSPYLKAFSGDPDFYEMSQMLLETKSNFSTQAKETAPCQLRQLFVSHNGDLFPCCRKWGDKKFKIANLNDNDICEKVLSYDVKCECEGFAFKKIEDTKNFTFTGINIEFSLDCNAVCAMCCVKAPGWSGKYDYYQNLKKFIQWAKPNALSVQGGEVLFQPKAMAWLREIKEEYPDIKLHIVSNGSFSTKIIPEVEYLFDSMTLSVVGFEKHTYKTIMGLDLDTTKRFAEELIKGQKLKLSLKYLCTPINIHQMGLFFDWALEAGPDSIQIVDADVKSYMVFDTFDSYWMKIFARTGKDLKNRLTKQKEKFEKSGIKLSISLSIKRLIGLDDKFLSDPAYKNIIKWY